MLEMLLSALGFLLILILFSEELKLFLDRTGGILQQHPILKFVAYPVGALLMVIAAGLIVNSLIKLMTAARFYE